MLLCQAVTRQIAKRARELLALAFLPVNGHRNATHQKSTYVAGLSSYAMKVIVLHIARGCRPAGDRDRLGSVEHRGLAVRHAPAIDCRAAGAVQSRASRQRPGHRLPVLSHVGRPNRAFAGMPPTKTCMTCHSQIWTNAADAQRRCATVAQPIKPIRWQRVNNVPDYVYFNHSIHVHKGVGCATCHGPVQDMPLTCQGGVAADEVVSGLPPRAREIPRPREQVFNMNYQPPKDQAAARARAGASISRPRCRRR